MYLLLFEGEMISGGITPQFHRFFSICGQIEFHCIRLFNEKYSWEVIHTFFWNFRIAKMPCKRITNRRWCCLIVKSISSNFDINVGCIYDDIWRSISFVSFKFTLSRSTMGFKLFSAIHLLLKNRLPEKQSIFYYTFHSPFSH